MKVLIEKSVYSSIIEDAKTRRNSSFIEACGLLAGFCSMNENGNQEINICEVYQTTNELNSDKHFRVPVSEQLHIIKEIRKNGLKLLGNWHSHLKAAAVPSAEDMFFMENGESGMIYIIVSLANESAPDLRAFSIIDNKAIELECVVEEDSF